MDEVLLNKAGIIERCLRRIKEEYAVNPARLENFTHQDAIVLNIERACQAAIGMAMHLIAKEHLGIPQSSAQAFDFLEQAGRISAELAASMRRMVGFRNIAVHQYQSLKLDVLRLVVESNDKDLLDFCACLGIRISR